MEHPKPPKEAILQLFGSWQCEEPAAQCLELILQIAYVSASECGPRPGNPAEAQAGVGAGGRRDPGISMLRWLGCGI